jgi:hypothetical protein
MVTAWSQRQQSRAAFSKTALNYKLLTETDRGQEF